MVEDGSEYWKKANEETKEVSRLADEAKEAERQIQEGINTSATQLDTFLAAQSAFHHFCAQHPEDDPYSPEQIDREDQGIEYLKYTKILKGGYHQEKADYCHEMYQLHRRNADGKEASREEDKARVRMYNHLHPENEDKERDEKGLRHWEEYIVNSRRYAANWLRTEANCLEMPTEKLAAQAETEEQA